MPAPKKLTEDMLAFARQQRANGWSVEKCCEGIRTHYGVDVTNRALRVHLVEGEREAGEVNREEAAGAAKHNVGKRTASLDARWGRGLELVRHAQGRLAKARNSDVDDYAREAAALARVSEATCKLGALYIKAAGLEAGSKPVAVTSLAEALASVLSEDAMAQLAAIDSDDDSNPDGRSAGEAPASALAN